jgi:hypothetical protein
LFLNFPRVFLLRTQPDLEAAVWVSAPICGFNGSCHICSFFATCHWP